MALVFFSLLALGIESRVALGDRGLQDRHLLGRRNGLLLLTLILGADLNEGRDVLDTELSGVIRDAIRSGGRDLLGHGLIASSLIRAAGNGVLVVVRNAVGLVTDAAGRGGSVHGAIGTIARGSLAVDTDGAVSSSAKRKVLRSS